MKRWIATISVAALAACNPKAPRPAGLASDTTMVMLLADMHILESAHNTKALEADSVPYTYAEIYAEIFRRHNVTKAQYDSTMMWLARDSQQLDAIYDQVIEELSKREAAVK
jgi:hypothetical protein